MDTATSQHLNALNREFYRVTVDNFDESRGRFWLSGWQRVIQQLVTSAQPLRVLDVGCGNGRFGRFLGKHFGHRVHYHGIDNNADLLTRAADDLRAYPAVSASFEEIDIVKQMPPEREYDLVVLFGVLHHVPGAAQRQTLLQTCADRVTKGGMMAFTAWCFYEYPRFRERIVDWDQQWQRESGDYLLDWRRGHAANSILRYCHYIDEAEQDQLVSASGLTEIARFRADGHTDDINRYSLLSKPA
ncbi:MAG: class I SAM-dependent methyltransferase [Anaerolineae bacterium]|nr:class I SAM-dependent methyltransferase [Anaerolineae bacterium]